MEMTDYNLSKTMAVDVLGPWITKPPASMVSSMCYKQVLALNGEEFSRPARSQDQENIGMFPQDNSAC